MEINLKVIKKMPKKTRAVVCMKWGSLYPAEYVNVLYNAVKANLKSEYRFICFTDNHAGLLPEIEVRPIVDMELPERAWQSGAWPKISVFTREAFDFEGRALFIDLDTIITGDLEQFFNTSNGSFRAIGPNSWTKSKKRKPAIYYLGKRLIASLKNKRKNTANDVAIEKRSPGIRRNTMGTGIFAFEIGEHCDIALRLMADVDFALNNYIFEQHFIENQLQHWEPWPDKTICSLKYHLRRPIWQSFWRHPMRPPEDISIVAFHGDPRPIDMVQKMHNSLREFPHMWFGKVKWVRDYWKTFSEE